MNLSKNPRSIKSIRKNTRFLLERLKELTRQRKFEQIIYQRNIANSLDQLSDVQICIQSIIEAYNCYLSPQTLDFNFPKRKQLILYNNLNTLNIRVGECVLNRKPIPTKYVANVLKSQTVFFNSIKSTKINKSCIEAYDRVLLSAISIWNNDWNL